MFQFELVQLSEWSPDRVLRLLPFLLFLTIPLTEIALFIAIGGQIGLLATVGIVILTAIVGTILLRQQGFSVVRRIQADMDAGRVPVAQLADGFCLLVAALLLLTPGFLTDSIGFLLFIPGVRQWIGRGIWSWFRNAEIIQTVRNEPGDHHGGPPPGRGRAPRTIDGEAVEIDPDEVSTDPPNPDSPWRA